MPIVNVVLLEFACNNGESAVYKHLQDQTKTVDLLKTESNMFNGGVPYFLVTANFM